ncbi:hypothetical protein Mapa_015928 [Marchantia paleacea]|nr:hypothetical protein Mapa_015928 [Marchantia paleacea]
MVTMSRLTENLQQVIYLTTILFQRSLDMENDMGSDVSEMFTFVMLSYQILCVAIMSVF